MVAPRNGQVPRTLSNLKDGRFLLQRAFPAKGVFVLSPGIGKITKVILNPRGIALDPTDG